MWANAEISSLIKPFSRYQDVRYTLFRLGPDVRDTVWGVGAWCVWLNSDTSNIKSKMLYTVQCSETVIVIHALIRHSDIIR